MKIVVSYTWGTLALGVTVFICILFVIGALVMPATQQKNVSPITTTGGSLAAVSQEGPVDVSVVRDASSTGTVYAFTVTADTHSGDLSTYDAQTNVVYRTRDGSDVVPTSVGGDRETHHRVMIVTFSNIALPGSIVVKNLRGVPERSFPFTQSI